MKIKIIFIALFISIFLIPVSAQEYYYPVVDENELIKNEYQNLKNQNIEFIKTVQQEREGHYIFVERTYKELKDFIQLAALIVGGIITLFGIIITFFGIKTLKEIKSKAMELAQDNYQKVIQENSKGLRDQLTIINAFVDRENNFKSNKIGFIYKEDNVIDLENITAVLNNRGFTNISPLKITSTTDETELNINTFDVFVYLIKDYAQEKELIKTKVVIPLRGVDKPLILYTSNTINIEELVAIHKWILPANSRISLLNNIFIVANLFR